MYGPSNSAYINMFIQQLARWQPLKFLGFLEIIDPGNILLKTVADLMSLGKWFMHNCRAQIKSDH